MTYTAKNLEDIAVAFDHCAWQATAFSDRLHKTQRDKRLAEREAATWKRAAQQLRETTLALGEDLAAIEKALDYASDHFERETSLGEDMTAENATLTAAREAHERLGTL